MDRPVNIVIGSGPAGAACASALVSRGENVLMLDAGIELEPELAKIVRELSESPYSAWQPVQLEAIRGDTIPDAKGIPIKKLFGSDFPYRETEEKIPWRGPGIALRPSLAFGGLSNVWGATMLSHRDQDISEWPVKNSELAEHYRAAAQITGLAACHDDLEDEFPLHCQKPDALRPSRQAALLLLNLQRRRDALRARGWRFGQSRLAVRSADSPRGPGCVYCAGCMTGCPYGCIYNSADTVRAMQRETNFRCQTDVIVTMLRENPDGVVIEGFNRLTRAPLSFKAGRVYLGAGVIPTAQILLRSQGAFDRALILRDSQYFLFPILLFRRVRDVHAETLHTLSQVFLELDRRQISRRPVHLQIYTYSDIIGQAVRNTAGPLRDFARPIEERLLVVQAYLHSDESSVIEMQLKRDGRKDFLQLEPRLNPETPRIIKRVLRELLVQFRGLGGVPLLPMLKIGEPGHSFHSGGSIPMRMSPRNFESDCLGRPSGWSRVHVVDASVLPSIPATTITFSVMANAHRIGSQSLP